MQKKYAYASQPADVGQLKCIFSLSIMAINEWHSQKPSAKWWKHEQVSLPSATKDDNDGRT
jgi:hypothetical protein